MLNAKVELEECLSSRANASQMQILEFNSQYGQKKNNPVDM
jgi:hypothetical protein